MTSDIEPVPSGRHGFEVEGDEALFRSVRPWLLATDLGMLTYWAVTAAFAPLWWGLNAALVLWPLGFLPRFYRAW